MDHFLKGIINLSSYSSKSYASVVLSDSKVAFLQEGSMQAFVYFYIVFCLYIALYNPRSILLNFFVFHTSGDIS